MITLVPYHPNYFEALTSYDLDEQQAAFALTPKYILTNPTIMSNKLRTQYCILYQQEPVGFFSLDVSDDRLLYTTNTQSILLRALSIMPQFQGRGIAKAALLQLPDLIHKHYVDIQELVFGVNYENTNAYHLYIKTGYCDSGRTYQGVKGPQHCMFKNLI
ncbi:GNAT family N-acetyltransferase [Myroides fluvii]|uniref:GNAT family N-acetyltransferase n=1 Tax=Myroides fluvii TaxID=2572594 RepID=UPI00131E7F7E|nr:GNAT family N-acetyltransferase [Myroides fluvii]